MHASRMPAVMPAILHAPADCTRVHSSNQIVAQPSDPATRRTRSHWATVVSTVVAAHTQALHIMNSTVATHRPELEPSNPRSKTVLAFAALSWFVVAVTGQLIFAAYVAVVYLKGIATTGLSGLGEVMSNGYRPGDLAGNVAVAAHMMFAFGLLLGGPLQLVPGVRTRFPRFHRWNGRIYVVGVLCASLAGLIMIWGRGTFALAVKLGGTLNALLIFTFAALALRAALARDFNSHGRWALRLFITATAVWFFRIILMVWVTAMGPVGIDFERGEGPFLELMAFGQYLIPLAILEVYLRARDSSHARAQWIVSSMLALCTLLMAGGIFMASLAEWLPPWIG